MSTSIPSHRDTARHAKRMQEPVDVTFALDDGSPVHWHTPLASITDSHFTTPGGLIVRYDAISHLATLSGRDGPDGPICAVGPGRPNKDSVTTETPVAKPPRKKAAK